MEYIIFNSIVLATSSPAICIYLNTIGTGELKYLFFIRPRLMAKGLPFLPTPMNKRQVNNFGKVCKFMYCRFYITWDLYEGMVS